MVLKCKMKYQLLIMMLLVLIPIVTGTVVQVSTDNITWVNISNTEYQGIINETTKVAGIFYLKEDTKYYFRASGTNNVWVYADQTTGGEMVDYTGIVLILIGIGIALLFASFKMSEQHRGAKLVCFFGAFPFFIGATFTGFEISKTYTNSAGFMTIFEGMFWAILVIFMVMVYFYGIDWLKGVFDYGNK